MIGKDSNVVYVSAASAWEIATKARLGKLPRAADVIGDLVGCVASQGFTPLDITLEHGERAGALGGAHRDPFDRMLAAQSQAENLPLVTNDPVFEDYGVTTIW